MKITDEMLAAFHKAYDDSLEMQPRETSQAIYDGLSAALQSVVEFTETPKVEQERDIWEVANQLGGYVDSSTDERLARFLIREANEAEKLAQRIHNLERENAELRHDIERHVAIAAELANDPAALQSAADTPAPPPQTQMRGNDELFWRLRIAYLRGAEWRERNGSMELSEKAAYDYADNVTSPLSGEVPAEPVGYLKPKFPQAIQPLYIDAADRTEEWQKQVFTIPVFVVPPAPQPKTTPTGIVSICPECDIAGCKHLRFKSKPLRITDAENAEAGAKAVSALIDRLDAAAGQSFAAAIADMSPDNLLRLRAAINAAIPPQDHVLPELPKLPPYSHSAFPHGFHELWTEKQMKQYARDTAAFWRNDVVEKAAQIAERYGVDPWIARDIRALAATAPEGSDNV